jgi:ketosteroid isomerase-like protein
MTPEIAKQTEALALKMMHAAGERDIETLRKFYTDDATLWFNFSGKTVSADTHLSNVGALQAKITNLRYEDIRVIPFDGGYVQQHTVRGDLADGDKLEIAACFVVRMRDGLIAHRDEYLDSAATAKLRDA